MTLFLLHSVSRIKSGQHIIHSDTLNRIGKKKSSNISFDDGYADIYTNFKHELKQLSDRVIIFIVAGKIGGINDWDRSGELAGKLLLDWEQIKELKAMGIRFGSHSMTHADLTKLSDHELERETKASKRILEDLLGGPVEGFAYPYGYFNADVITAVKNAGYKWAVTTSDCVWEGWGNPFRSGRTAIYGHDPKWLISAKLNGLYNVKSVWEFPCLVVQKMKYHFTKEHL